MTLTIIYSSWWGNTALVVKKVTDILAKHRVEVEMINAIVATPDDLKKTDTVLLAAPTYDHGILHAPMDRLVLGSQDIDLSGHRFAIIGLGDSKYDQEYTCEAGHLLANFVKDHGWTIIHKQLLINKSPVDKLETTVTDRTTTLLTHL